MARFRGARNVRDRQRDMVGSRNHSLAGYVGVLCSLLCTGCQTQTGLLRASADWWNPFHRPKTTPEPASVRTPALASNPENNPLTFAERPATDRPEARAVRLDVTLATLHVQIPHADRERVEPMWNFLREDAVDAATGLRLARNGIRVGIGQEASWDAIQATLGAIPGARNVEVPPLRLPPNYPLALEMDTAPHDQTLFYVGEDDVLTGETWRQSRNVLRTSYMLDLTNADRVRVLVVPEVRQKQDGFKWIRSDAGIAQVPNYSGRAYGAAGFVSALSSSDFLVIAAARDAAAYGLIGGAFLTADDEGQRFDSIVFIRVDVRHVPERN